MCVFVCVGACVMTRAAGVCKPHEASDRGWGWGAAGLLHGRNFQKRVLLQ